MQTISSRLQNLAQKFSENAEEIISLINISNKYEVSNLLQDVLNFNDTAHAFTRATIVAHEKE